MDEYDNKTKDDDETNTDGSESISLKRGQQYDGGVSPVRGSSLNRRRRSVSSDNNNKSSVLLNTLHKGDTNKLIGREEENATKVRRRSRSGRLIGQGFSSRRQCVIPASIKTNNKDQSPPQQQCIISQEVDNDPQAELNNYCHDYFNNKQKKNDDSSNNKQHYLSSSSSSSFPQKKKKQIDPPEEKQLEPPTPTTTKIIDEGRKRCKSMPPLTESIEIHLDKIKFLNEPISPVASIDSSWRYKRLKQKHRRKEKKLRKKQRKQEEAEERNNRMRSKSCDSALDFMAIVPYDDEYDGGADTILEENTYTNYQLGEEILPGRGDEGYYNNDNRKRESINRSTASSNSSSSHNGNRVKCVDNMPYMEHWVNNMGFYSGEINDNGQPNGTGTIQYDNGMAFEGKWTNGIRDDTVYELKKKVEALRQKQVASAAESRRRSLDKRDDSTFGSSDWGYGRAPEPISSMNGSYKADENSASLIRDALLMSPGGGESPGAGDSPTTRATAPDPPEACIDDIKPYPPPVYKAKDPPEKSFNDREPSSSSQENDETDDKGNKNDGKSLGLTTLEASEKKNTVVAPPLHSAIRLKKPSAAPSINSKSSHKSSALSSSSSKKKGVKAHISEIKVKPMLEKTSSSEDSLTSSKKSGYISELTMPQALRRAPPLHSRIRANKPGHTKDHLSKYGESKLMEEHATDDSHVRGPLTGNEIDVHSNTGTNAMSELTIPVALSAPFAQALKSYSKQKQQQALKEKDERLQKLRAQKIQEAQIQLETVQARMKQKQYPPPDHNQTQQQQQKQQQSVSHPPPPRRPVPPPPPRSIRSSNSSQASKSAKGGDGGSNVSMGDSNTLGRYPTAQLVKKMPYINGMYSGQVNCYGLPHGQGTMNYDNGMFFEGKWTNGKHENVSS